MIKLPFIENIDLEPFWNDDINNSIAMRHHLLFAFVQDRRCSVVEKESMAMALNYLSKFCLLYTSPSPRD